MSGLRHVGPIGTPGHDKQTTPDFFAEFVKCSRERYYVKSDITACLTCQTMKDSNENG